jgi:hypothetical protein
MAGTKDFFEQTWAHLLRRVRHSLASQGGITRAVRVGDLTRKFAKIEHLSAFHKVLGTHNTAEAIFLPNERIIASFASRKSRSSYPYKL